jgi:ribose 5-phosphate isomerase RpiB
LLSPHYTISDVDFDVAVSVTDISEGKAKAGLVVCGIGVGASGSLAQTNNTVSRIKFSVPVVFPHKDK